METFSALLACCEGKHRSPVDSPHKGQWRGALMFSLLCTWTNGWVNSRDAGDLRRHRAHDDFTVMIPVLFQCRAMIRNTKMFPHFPIRQSTHKGLFDVDIVPISIFGKGVSRSLSGSVRYEVENVENTNKVKECICLSLLIIICCHQIASSLRTANVRWLFGRKIDFFCVIEISFWNKRNNLFLTKYSENKMRYPNVSYYMPISHTLPCRYDAAQYCSKHVYVMMVFDNHTSQFARMGSLMCTRILQPNFTT